MTEFSQTMKRLARKNQHINNYVKCARCGHIIYRTPSRRRSAMNNFCSKSCSAAFYMEKLKVASRWRWLTSYNQQAFGVSPEIAQALRTGEYP